MEQNFIEISIKHAIIKYIKLLASGRASVRLVREALIYLNSNSQATM